MKVKGSDTRVSRFSKTRTHAQGCLPAWQNTASPPMLPRALLAQLLAALVLPTGGRRSCVGARSTEGRSTASSDVAYWQSRGFAPPSPPQHAAPRPPLPRHTSHSPPHSPFVCTRGHYRPSSSCTFNGLRLLPSGQLSTLSYDDDDARGGGGGGGGDGGLGGATDPVSIPASHLGGSAFRTWNVSIQRRRAAAATSPAATAATPVTATTAATAAMDAMDATAACCLTTHRMVLFSVHYLRGGSNNYHLHWDTLLPLYALLRERGAIDGSSGGGRIVQSYTLAPTVELGYLPGNAEGVVWGTDAFAYGDEEEEEEKEGHVNTEKAETNEKERGTIATNTTTSGRRRGSPLRPLPYWIEAPALFSNFSLFPLAASALVRLARLSCPRLPDTLPPAAASVGSGAVCADIAVAGVPTVDWKKHGGAALVNDFADFVLARLRERHPESVGSGSRGSGDCLDVGSGETAGADTCSAPVHATPASTVEESDASAASAASASSVPARGGIRVAYVSRRTAKRRRILNEDEVVRVLRRVARDVQEGRAARDVNAQDAGNDGGRRDDGDGDGDVEEEEEKETNAMDAAHSVHSVDFAGMSFAAQAQLMGKYDLIVGLQGAGMTNTIYRRKGAAVLLLFPLSEMDNAGIWDPLLRPRGPYRRWFNTHRANSVFDAKVDPYGDNPDTVVHAGELYGEARRALEESVEAQRRQGGGGAEE